MFTTTILLGLAFAFAATGLAAKAPSNNEATLGNLDPLTSSFYEATLFVSSYSGVITTLSLTNNLGAYALTSTANHSGCAPSPSWLVLDKPNDVLYCINEGLNVPNGSVSSFKIQSNGTLLQNVNVTTQAGPVSGTLFGAKPTGKNATKGTPSRGLAVAH